MLWFLLGVIVILLAINLINVTRAEKENKELFLRCSNLQKRCDFLSKYEKIKDVEAEALRILTDAKTKAETAFISTQEYRNTVEQQAQDIINNARQKAQEIAGDALDARNNAKLYEQTVKAMKNIILGYGSDYLIPSRNLLDELADTYGYTQASEDYKNIRKKVRDLVKNNLAADCDYVETNRRHTAICFITDAFNGKVDTIIAQSKSDNFGTLRTELIDAFSIVNFNGTAFKNARINQSFFELRMEELRLACVLREIHQRDLEEQREIREKMREEEKARREIEKALKDAQKEEEMLQKAMDKARAQLEKANAEQRAKYEAQIAELELKYKEAEERNKRALSMAQQTKSGHVYIISNIGSFGENVYKIGMTRRLEPLDRIRELSSASVPFPFEVHAMIWSENAPALENMLHKKFALAQVNKVNFRKEFFRISLADIRAELEQQNLNVKWTIAAETSEYLESLSIERIIQDNEQARNDWLNHQLDINSFDDEEQEDEAV